MRAVPDRPAADARDAAYAERLRAVSGARWKRVLDVQAPYRWHLRRLRLGRTLEVGCGIGRNLLHLRGSGVGVDPNAAAVAIARERGCAAYTPDEFLTSPHARAGGFDSLLFAHVVEHMSFDAARALVAGHLGWLRAAGRVVLIAPQEAGWRSDPTHVEYMDFPKLERLLFDTGLEHVRSYSFPFPRPFGRLFPHNEFVVVGRKPGPAGRHPASA